MDGYKKLFETIPDNQIEEVRMNDGAIIKCKKVPLTSLENMDVFLTGVKDGLNLANNSLSYIASCGGTPLYSAVGDVSTYMRNKEGNILSSSVNSKGKITGQPGFQESGLTKEGLKAAATAAKLIPYVAIAVTIIEISTKIVMHQKEIKANQDAFYDRHCEINEDSINNLWQVINDYTLAKNDEAHRIADLGIIKTSFNEANNSFIKLNKNSKDKKHISDHLVYAMKTALDVYSFAYLLKIMYSKVEDFSGYIENAINDIKEKTEIYEKIFDKCYQQYLTYQKRNKDLSNTVEFKNKDPNTKDIAKRVTFDLATGGVSEIGSLISKGKNKKGTKTDSIIKKLDMCKNSGNPYIDCIENAYAFIECKNKVLRDDKYLYYQVD